MNTSYAKRLLTQSAWRQQQILLLPPPLTQLSLTEVIRWASNVRYDYLQTPWSQPHRQTCTDSATDTKYTTTTQHSHYYITFKHLDHSLADKLVLTLQQTPITLLQHITVTTATYWPNSHHHLCRASFPKVCNVGNDYCINPLQCKGLQCNLW